MSTNTVIDTSIPADVKPIDENWPTAEVLRLALCPSYAMRRRQIVYELRNGMGPAWLYVGTTDLLEVAEEVIRREEMIHKGITKNGSDANRARLIAQACDQSNGGRLR